MPKYDIYRGTRRIHTSVSAKKTADLVDVHLEELAWCIEEYGRCDGPELTAIEHKETNPDPFPALDDLGFNPDETT